MVALLGVLLWIILAATTAKYLTTRPPLAAFDRVGAAVYFVVIGVPVFVAGLMLILEPAVT